MKTKTLIVILTSAAIGAGALWAYQYANRTPAEKLGDDVSSMFNKVGDSIKDAGNDIEDEIDEHTK